MLSIWTRLKFRRLLMGVNGNSRNLFLICSVVCKFLLKGTLLKFNRPLTLSQTILCFYRLHCNAIETTAVKGEFARNEQFLLFTQCFFFKLLEIFPPFFIRFDIVVCELFQFRKGSMVEALNTDMKKPFL